MIGFVFVVDATSSSSFAIVIDQGYRSRLCHHRDDSRDLEILGRGGLREQIKINLKVYSCTLQKMTSRKASCISEVSALRKIQGNIRRKW